MKLTKVTVLNLKYMLLNNKIIIVLLLKDKTCYFSLLYENEFHMGQLMRANMLTHMVGSHDATIVELS